MDELEESKKLLVTRIGDPYKDGSIFDKLNLKNIDVNVKTYKYENQIKKGRTVKQETDFFKIRMGTNTDDKKRRYVVNIYFKGSGTLLASTQTQSFEEALKYYKGSALYLKEREY